MMTEYFNNRLQRKYQERCFPFANFKALIREDKDDEDFEEDILPDVICLLKECDICCEIDYDNKTCTVNTIEESIVSEAVNRRDYVRNKDKQTKGINQSHASKEGISGIPLESSNIVDISMQENGDYSQVIQVPPDFISFLKECNICCEFDYSSRICTVHAIDEATVEATKGSYIHTKDNIPKVNASKDILLRCTPPDSQQILNKLMEYPTRRYMCYKCKDNLSDIHCTNSNDGELKRSVTGVAEVVPRVNKDVYLENKQEYV